VSRCWLGVARYATNYIGMPFGCNAFILRVPGADLPTASRMGTITRLSPSPFQRRRFWTLATLNISEGPFPPSREHYIVGGTAQDTQYLAKGRRATSALESKNSDSPNTPGGRSTRPTRDTRFAIFIRIIDTAPHLPRSMNIGLGPLFDLAVAYARPWTLSTRPFT